MDQERRAAFRGLLNSKDIGRAVPPEKEEIFCDADLDDPQYLEALCSQPLQAAMAVLQGDPYRLTAGAAASLVRAFGPEPGSSTTPPSPQPKLHNVHIVIPCSYKDDPDKVAWSGGSQAEICNYVRAAGVLGVTDMSKVDLTQYGSVLDLDPALEYTPPEEVEFRSNQQYVCWRLGNQPEVNGWISRVACSLETLAAEKGLAEVQKYDPSAYRVGRNVFQSQACLPTNSAIPLIKIELDGLIVAKDVVMLVEVKNALTLDAITQTRRKQQQIKELVEMDLAMAGPDAELFRGKKILVALVGRHAPSQPVKAALQQLVETESWAVWLTDESGLRFVDVCFKVPDAAELIGTGFARSFASSSRSMSSRGANAISSTSTGGGSSSANGSASRSFAYLAHVSPAWTAVARQERPKAALQMVPKLIMSCMHTALAALKKL